MPASLSSPPSSPDTLEIQVVALRRYLKEFASRDDKTTALRESQQAAIEARQAGDIREEAIMLLVQGKIYGLLNDFAATEEPFQKGLELWTALKDEPGIAIALWELGNQFVHRGREEEALPYLERALPLFRKFNDRYGEALTLTTLAIIYKKTR